MMQHRRHFTHFNKLALLVLGIAVLSCGGSSIAFVTNESVTSEPDTAESITAEPITTVEKELPSTQELATSEPQPTEAIPVSEVSNDDVSTPTVPPAVAVVATQPSPSTPPTTESIMPITGPEMISIPAGNFLMGSSETDVETAVALCNPSEGNCLREWFLHETPQHTVFVDNFLMTKYEITNAQYQQCVDAGVCQPPHISSDTDIPDNLSNFAGDNRPVVGVSWYDAGTYCQWIEARLPTEAEWERAARGTEGQIFPWGIHLMQTRPIPVMTIAS